MIDGIKEYLSYNMDTGVFIWIRKPAARISIGSPAGTLTKKGYVRIKFKGKKYMAHKLAFFFRDEPIPDIVDHKDGVRHNNRWNNLRACTHQENIRNAKRYDSNTSGVKNVHWNKQKEMWTVKFTFDGTKRVIGHFKDIELAELVAREAREYYYGEFARDE